MTAPTIQNQIFTVAPNAPAGTIIGIIQASDNGVPITFVDLSGDAQIYFNVSSSGTIIVNQANFPASTVLSIQACNANSECSSTVNITINTTTGDTLYPTPYLYFGNYTNSYFMPFPGIGNLGGTIPDNTNDNTPPTGSIGSVFNNSSQPFGTPNTSIPNTFGADWGFIAGNYYYCGNDSTIYYSPYSVNSTGTEISITGPVNQIPTAAGGGFSGIQAGFISGTNFYSFYASGGLSDNPPTGLTTSSVIDFTSNSLGSPTTILLNNSSDSFGPLWGFINGGYFYYGNESCGYYAPYPGFGNQLTGSSIQILDNNGQSLSGIQAAFMYGSNFYYATAGQTFYASFQGNGTNNQLGPATEIKDIDGNSFGAIWMFMGYNNILNPPIVDANQTFSITRDAIVGAVIGYISASNLNGAATTFKEVDPTANPYFTVNPSGVIVLSAQIPPTTTNPATVPSPQILNVQVVTTYGTSATAPINIIIQSVIKPQTFGISPTIQPGTNFGAIYVDSDSTYTFAITSSQTNPIFGINSSTGQLSYTSGTLSTETSYPLTVVATNTVTSVTHTTTITILVETGLPFTFKSGQSFTANPNQATIGNISFDNPSGSLVNFQFNGSGTPYSYFTLNSTTCALSAISIPIPPSGPSGYPLTIQETNSNVSTTITVYVFNPGPQIQNQTLASVSAKTYTQVTSIDDISAFDVNGSPITFSITSVTDPNSNLVSPQNLFQLSPSPGPNNNQLEIQSGATLISGNYSIIISATAAGISNTATITLPVSDYTAPVIDAGQNFYIKTTAAVGDFIGTVGASGAGATLIFSDVSSTPSPYFQIHPTGSITVSATIPQSVAPNPQVITVQVADSEGSTNQGNINVYVLGVLFPQTFEINENAQENTVIGTISINGSLQQYTLAIGVNTSPPLFSINGNGQLIFDGMGATYPLGDIGTSYTITVTATDNTTSVIHIATMTINVVADALFSILPGQSFSVTPEQTSIGPVAYNNPSGGVVSFEPLSISDSTNATFFSISPEGILSVSTNSLPVNTYTVGVSANGASQSVTIVTSGPHLQNQAFTINTVFGANNALGTIFVSDLNGDTVTLSINPSNSGFQIGGTNNDILMTSGTPPTTATTPGSPIELTIKAVTSASGLFSTGTISVTVIEYASPIIDPNQEFYITKNTPINTFVGYISATDPNGGSLIFTDDTDYSSTTQFFTVNSSGAIFTKALLTSGNFTSQTLLINAKNSGGLSAGDTPVTIHATSVLLPQTFEIIQTAQQNIPFATVSIDGSIQQFTLALSVNAAPVFSINANGQLSYTGTLGISGTTYSITVTATDTITSVVHSAVMTINVVTDALFFIPSGQSFLVGPGQTSIGGVGYDNPSGGTVTFSSLTTSDPTNSAYFSISSQGILTITTNSLPVNTYTVTVSANGVSQFISIVVSGVHLQSQSFTINTAFGANNAIGTIFVSDLNGDSVTLSINPSNSQFQLGGTNNDVLMTSSTPPTTPTSIGSPIELTIQAVTTQAGLSTTGTISVIVTEYDPPIIDPDQEFYIKKSAPVGSFVGYISAIDPNGGSLIFTDETDYSTNVHYFNVHSSGAIFVNESLAPVNFTLQTLFISATNSGGLSAATTTITIHALSVLFDQTFDINPTTPVNARFASILIDDNASTYTLSIAVNDPDITFAISPTNQLSYTAGTISSVIGTSYQIIVLATSNDSTTPVTHTGTMTIVVTTDTLFSIIPDQVFTISTTQLVVGNISYDNPNGNTVTFVPLDISSQFTLSTTGLLSVNGTNPGPGTYNLTATANEVSTNVQVIILANGPQIQSAQFSITTHYGASKLIGTIFTSDIDGDSVTLSILSTSPLSAAASFTLTGNKLFTSSTFTSLPSEEVSLIIQASSEGQTSQATIIIEVGTENFEVQNQLFILPNNLTVGTTFGPIVVVNPENVPLSFSISSTPYFSINSATGFLTVISASIQSQTTVQFTVTVSSNEDVSKNALISVFVTPGTSLIANFPLTVNLGEKGVISSALLQGIPETIFTITTPPTAGNIFKNTDITTSFSQTDINNGIIFYQSTGTVAAIDNFTFYTNNNVSLQVFQINIVALTISKVETQNIIEKIGIGIGVLGAVGAIGVVLGGIALIKLANLSPPSTPSLSEETDSKVLPVGIEAMPGVDNLPPEDPKPIKKTSSKSASKIPSKILEPFDI